MQDFHFAEEETRSWNLTDIPVLIKVFFLAAPFHFLIHVFRIHNNIYLLISLFLAKKYTIYRLNIKTKFLFSCCVGNGTILLCDSSSAFTRVLNSFGFINLSQIPFSSHKKATIYDNTSKQDRLTSLHKSFQ